MAERQSRTVEKSSVIVYRLRPGKFAEMEQGFRTTSETETAKCVFHVAEVYA